MGLRHILAIPLLFLYWLICNLVGALWKKEERIEENKKNEAVNEFNRNLEANQQYIFELVIDYEEKEEKRIENEKELKRNDL